MVLLISLLYFIPTLLSTYTMFRLAHLAKITAFGSALLASNLACFSKKTEYPFVEVVQYNANDPIEDRYSYAKLKSIKGFTASVFDGHGGDLVAEYASKNLNKAIDNRITQNLKLGLPTEQLIEKSLKEAYKEVEDGFYSIFKSNLHNKAYLTVGSCALTAVILKNTMHVANAGDCEGVILSKNQAAMTNLRLNAGEPFQQARLIKDFPGEPDIFVCKSACYVKGRLQPTRSFGDFYLKSKEYNFTNVKVFTGPYISAVPLVTHFKLTEDHKNLIMATDGLWDEMNAKQMHSIFIKNRENLGKRLFDRALQLILKNNSIKSFQKLNNIRYRRNIHDDITIVNVKLDELRKQL